MLSQNLVIPWQTQPMAYSSVLTISIIASCFQNIAIQFLAISNGTEGQAVVSVLSLLASTLPCNGLDEGGKVSQDMLSGSVWGAKVVNVLIRNRSVSLVYAAWPVVRTWQL